MSSARLKGASVGRRLPLGRIGLALPQFRVGGPVPVEEIRMYAEKAEAAGVEALWVMEAFFTSAAAHDPLSLLTFAAAATTTPWLATATLVLPRYDPVVLAKSLATIDHLSRGRLVAGMSVGEADEVVAWGIDPRERGEVFEARLARMRALWGEEATRGAEAVDEAFEPKPLQRPLPVIIGGRSRPAIRRAVELADGWIGGGFTTKEEFAKHVDVVREQLGEAGRDSDDFVVGKRAYVAVDRPAASAADWFRGVYGPIDGSRGLVFGSIDECLEQLQEFQDLGADHLILNPVGDDLAQLETIVDTVLPALR